MRCSSPDSIRTRSGGRKSGSGGCSASWKFTSEDSAGALTVTCPRIIAEPNASTTIASRVRLWIDARSQDPDELDAWMTRLREGAERLASRSGVGINLQIASRSDGREFSQALRASLADAARELLGQPVPELVCSAGHDAGVLAERIPAAMVLVA